MTPDQIRDRLEEVENLRTAGLARGIVRNGIRFSAREESFKLWSGLLAARANALIPPAFWPYTVDALDAVTGAVVDVALSEADALDVAGLLVGRVATVERAAGTAAATIRSNGDGAAALGALRALVEG